MQASVAGRSTSSRRRGDGERPTDNRADTTAATAVLKKKLGQGHSSAAQTAINYFTRHAGGEQMRAAAARGPRRPPARRGEGHLPGRTGPHGGDRGRQRPGVV